MRFRRVLKGLDLESHPASTGWRPYFGLDIDPVSESFVVLLNPEGTRLLRSWRHVEHCAQCGGEATGELSLDDLRQRGPRLIDPPLGPGIGVGGGEARLSAHRVWRSSLGGTLRVGLSAAWSADYAAFLAFGPAGGIRRGRGPDTR